MVMKNAKGYFQNKKEPKFLPWFLESSDMGYRSLSNLIPFLLCIGFILRKSGLRVGFLTFKSL